MHCGTLDGEALGRWVFAVGVTRWVGGWLVPSVTECTGFGTSLDCRVGYFLEELGLGAGRWLLKIIFRVGRYYLSAKS